ALRVHLVAVPLVKGSTQELAALCEDAIIALAHLLKQACGTFYIGEEQGDRSRRQLMHAAPPDTGDTTHSRSTWTNGPSHGLSVSAPLYLIATSHCGHQVRPMSW